MRLIVPTKAEWDVIEGFLSDIAQGALVIPPKVAAELKESHGVTFDRNRYSNFDYDNGGEPDYAFDVLEDPTHYGIDDVMRQFGPVPPSGTEHPFCTCDTDPYVRMQDCPLHGWNGSDGE